MTKLEEEMFFAIHEFGPKDGGNTANKEFDKELNRQAIAAAEVAKKYIEMAFNESRLTERGMNGKYFYSLDEWLKLNGIIP